MRSRIPDGSLMGSKRCNCPLLINLPSEIIITIIARLPIRTIIACKCVCKELLSLLSSPEFVAYHLSLSAPGILISHVGDPEPRGTHQIIECEDEFEFPLHNLRYNTVMKFDPRMCTDFPHHHVTIIGSVNGILCLGVETERLCTLYLCNPITGESIALPRIHGTVGGPDNSEFGFGVSRITGQYKVVGNVTSYSEEECLVHTVGTRSWRNLQPSIPLEFYYPIFTLFLNGNIHGLQNSGITCFDLETESFEPFPQPPLSYNLPAFCNLGNLDNCLCLVENCDMLQDSNTLVIWVMKEYLAKESWTKQLIIVGSPEFLGGFYNTHLIKAFKDGDILFHDDFYILYFFCNKTKTCKEFDFVVQDHGSTTAMSHNSSFLSLKSFYDEDVISFW